MNILRNVSVRCPSCNTAALGRPYPVNRSDGSIMEETKWNCHTCGRFLKVGFTGILKPAPDKK